MPAATPSSTPSADKEPVRYGIRFLLAVTTAILAALTAGVTTYAYLSLDRLQERMEELAEGNLEEITLAGRLHDATEALLRPINLMADVPAEVPTTASLNGVRMQLKEVRGTADTLAARLAGAGAGPDKERMAAALQGLDATEQAIEAFAAAARRRSDAERRRRELLVRLESQLDQHFEHATRTESQIRTLAAHTLGVDLPDAAGRGQLQPRLESFLEREMNWLGTAQNLRTDNRELLSIVRAIGREANTERLAEAQRSLESYAARLAAWRRLPDNDGVRALGKSTDALAAVLTANPSLPRVRAEELTAETTLVTSARACAQTAARFSERIDEVANGLGHDVRERIRQTRTEVQRAQATLTSASIVSTIIAILLIYGVVTRRVIHPLERITGSMRRAASALSDGNPNWQTALIPPPAWGNDEVAAMYRALRIFRDILVSRQQETERSQAQLRTILLTINEAIQLWDGKGRLVFCNVVAHHLLGMAAGGPGDATASAGWQYLHEDGTAFLRDEFPHTVTLRKRTGQTGVIMQAINPTGVSHWLLINAQPVQGASPDEILGVVISCSDISEFKLHQAELEHLAHHDPLTELPNRTLLEDRLEHAINQADRNGALLAVCYLDLDGFKPINDQYGHAAGDLLLQEIAQRLKANLRGGDTVARLGGDEFVLLLAAIDDIAECRRTLKRVLQNICAPCTLGIEPEACASVTASIGVTIYPIDKSDSNGLLRHADHAMYLAKQAGKNTFHVFYPEPPDGTRYRPVG